MPATRLLCCTLFVAGAAPAFAQADSSATITDSATVLPGFELVHPLPLRTGTAVSVMDSTLLLDFERSGLRSSLQFVPGVQMDERGHGGSMRLSIRGGLMRSPFGVRNVKVYWGAVPLTLADGSTTLELLDPLVLDRMDVMRGVGHPRYGAAPSGVLLVTPPLEQHGPAAFAEAIAGPWGFSRLAARVGASSEGNAFVAGILRQRNDGYRDQEWSSRDQAFLASQWSTERLRWQVFLTAQDGRWALPGSLDATTAHDAPRSARSYSQRIDARVEKQQFTGGMALEQRFGRKALLRTSIGGTAIDKFNPYGTTPAVSGSKEEDIGAINARLSLASNVRLGSATLAYETGVEALWERDVLEERAFVEAEPDTVRIDARTEAANVCLFASVRAEFTRGWTLAAAIGSDATAFRHTDQLHDAVPEERSLAAALPTVALERLHGRMRYHARYARSASRPTIWELLGTRGTFNEELQPEKWSEVELGVTDLVPSGGLSLTLYHRQVEDLIVEVQDDSGSTFVNGGDARFSGAEADFRMDRALGARWHLRSIASLALQQALQDPGGTESTLPVAGVEPLSVKLLVRAQYGRLPYLEATVRTWSGITADGKGEDEIPDGAVLALRTGHAFQWRTVRLETFLHCENVLDQQYNSWVQVNDPGGRYYNPAPTRSFFLGLQLFFHGADRS